MSLLLLVHVVKHIAGSRFLSHTVSCMLEKNTPRDVILHLGAFIILYLSAISLIALLFSVINYAIPDELMGQYTDPYSTSMRLAIASLVVMTPILVYLFYIIQSAARKDPERRSLGVRKWLTYITLLVTGATIVGDLIVLLNAFLGGSLPQSFMLKVLVILLSMGAGFGYFYLDIKGYWQKNVEYSRYVGIGILLVVLVSIVGGMTLIGSPTKQRELRLDAQQVTDLMMVQSWILNYRYVAGTLPMDMDAIEDPAQGLIVPESPEDRPEYSYRKTGENSFELCATFAQASLPTAYTKVVDPSLGANATWDHAAGPVCFSRTIDPAYFEKPTDQKPAGIINMPAPVNQ